MAAGFLFVEACRFWREISDPMMDMASSNPAPAISRLRSNFDCLGRTGGGGAGSGLRKDLGGTKIGSGGVDGTGAGAFGDETGAEAVTLGLGAGVVLTGGREEPAA